jgi:hypothetical protein
MEQPGLSRWADQGEASTVADTSTDVALEGTPVICRRWQLEVGTAPRARVVQTMETIEEPPPLELPPLQQQPSRMGRRGRRGWRMAQRVYAPVSRRPSRVLDWHLAVCWMADLRRRVAAPWLVDYMALHLLLTFFGGASWQHLRAMRAHLRGAWPRNWKVLRWIVGVLESEPC